MNLDRSKGLDRATSHFDGSGAAYDVVPVEGGFPKILQQQPMILPRPVALVPNWVAALRHELQSRAAADQRVRIEEVGHEEWQRVDKGNADWIRGVLTEVGWTNVRSRHSRSLR